jgi:PAS domain-containing protein
VREGGAHLASRAIRYRIRRPDGALRNIEARYGEIRDHGKRYRFGLVMDVTDVAVLNEQLEDNSAWLDIAMESINVVFWDRDLVTGRRAHVGQLRVRSSASSAGRTDWQFADFLTVVHPDDHAVLEAALASTLARNDEYGPSTASSEQAVCIAGWNPRAACSAMSTANRGA